MFSSFTPPPDPRPAVLVVERHAGVRQVLQRMLTHVGSLPTAVEDAAGAVAAVLAQPELALALINLGQDDSDGVSAVSALRAVRPDLPIVLMSADPAQALVIQPLVGARSVLGKPCSLSDLAELVGVARRLAGRAGAEPTACAQPL